jgi:carbonic anhydrase
MNKLIRGVHKFQNDFFSSQQELFTRLAKGQSPETLFIACSDSRINPNLLTQTEPGELFILRNAGNIIPPYGAANGGEGATIEYAVTALGVKDIIVCGHSHCGAMKGLLHSEDLVEMPSMAAWLKHAEATRQIILKNYQDYHGSDRLSATIKENVLVQLENLRTHPAVSVKLSQGELHMHAWVYEIENGKVYTYNIEEGQFVPLSKEVTGALTPRACYVRKFI